MCYSKEVQLATGSIMISLCIYYYIKYSLEFEALSKKWLIPFLKNMLIGLGLVGGHQIFEFLSVITGNILIYKAGLIVSLSSIYFLVRALEALLNRDFKSKIVILIIGLVILNVFSTEMFFSTKSFYIRHYSATLTLWPSAWMFVFIYFHFCSISGYRKLLKNEISKKLILLFWLTTIDFSFLLSLAYVLWGYSKFSVNVCTDSPSIWCTFAVMQMLTLPICFVFLPKIFKVPKEKTKQTLKTTILLCILSLVTLLLLIIIMPFFNCLSYKMLFP